MPARRRFTVDERRARLAGRHGLAAAHRAVGVGIAVFDVGRVAGEQRFDVLRVPGRDQAGIVGGQIGIGSVVEAQGPLIAEMRVASEEGRHSSPHPEPVI